MKIRLYLPNVLLTFLLVFSVLLTQAVLFAKYIVLNADTFRIVAEQQTLSQKAHTALQQEFRKSANSTGIPEEVFLDSLNEEMLKQGILDSVSQAFAYLHGETEDYHVSMEFSGLENSVRNFFEEYAEEIHYEKDAAYEEKVSSVIANAEAKILFAVDTFKFSVMYRNGWLTKARGYMPYLDTAIMGSIALTAVILFLLLLCNRKQWAHLAYWCGLAGFLAGGLLLFPCIWLSVTDYFSAFAVKDPQIFSAVVGFLQLLTARAAMLAGITLGIGIVLLILFAILHKKKAGT